ncbi:ABC transporter permease [Chryseoglobus sp. 28M-23]|uniref:ABC transporter permease n=1 Tax=Chryseoglobus sp. 28M-23 TaxID=2772253 RepID=UPI0017469FAF|nr:ABC transporter permease [Chryseoglobus sp. 28M-23]QOD93242.1 ABC transporter permease [Chryseoglobus sp. 28M-23]
MTYAKELLATRELLSNLVMREVKGQYRRTVLGQLWSLVNPIATMLVYTVVFSFIFRAQPDQGDPSGLDIYPLWLMCGLLPWMYFSRVVNGGLNSMVSNANLIKKVYFPRMHLPFSVMSSVGITWGIEMSVLTLAIWIFGGFPIPWLPLVVLTMGLLALFAVGVAMMLAILNVHFRDTQHFTTIVLQMWMYLTPIIYPISLVEEGAREIGDWVLFVYRLNPMEHFVNVFRNLLYDNRLPALDDTLWMFGSAGIVFALGYLIFSRNEKRLAELL